MLRVTIQNYLLNKGVYTSRMEADSQIALLIQRLRPMQAERALIRVGGPGDGGYLVPDDLDGITACFSPGVSNVATFEADLAKRGIECFLADYSVDSAPLSSPRIHFEKKFIAATNDDTHMRLETWINRHASGSGDLLLQMDIEDGEYEVLLDTSSEVLSRFRIMVIEFHYLHALFDRLGSVLIKFVFQKILNNFVVLHIHPNNAWSIRKLDEIEIPPVMEFTFYRKDRALSLQAATHFPHPLDCVNDQSVPDVVLPSAWHLSNKPLP
jgi:Methyltransferase FkbM domain